MSLILVDTNIVPYLYKQDSRGMLYEPHLLGQEIGIALMTVAELLQWAAFRNWACHACSIWRQPSAQNILSCLSILIRADGGQPSAHNVQLVALRYPHKMLG